LPKIAHRNSKVIETIKGIPPQVDKLIIIPSHFRNKKIQRNYFNPRFLHLVKGRQFFVEWENQDNFDHNLIFYEISVRNRTKNLGETGRIKPGQSKTLKFNFRKSTRIDYICKLHKNEFGTVVIYPKEEEDMSNTDQLRFLRQIFDI